MGILDGNPKKEPMHYGEVTAIWAFIGANNGLISGYEAFTNHAEDADLIHLLEDAVKTMRKETKELGEALKANGITPPPALPERPKANPEEIPAGARFNDVEIAAAVSINVGQGLVSCSMAMGQCLREDIAAMFAKYHHEKIAFGAKLLSLNKSKGWIIPPPLHMN